MYDSEDENNGGATADQCGDTAMNLSPHYGDEHNREDEDR
jgi:hypothetical protein